MSKHAFIFLLLLQCIGTISCFGKAILQAKVYEVNTQKPLSNVEVVYKTQILAVSNQQGEFSITLPKDGTYNLVLFHENYEFLETTVALSKGVNTQVFTLMPLSVDLSEFEIKARRAEVFGLRKLQDVEGVTINAGRKTEVVVMEKIAANKAANLSRQIYAQVAGLNIYEGSDGGLQLALGGRGLDPNRTSNFNTRQNGYDISADVLGYPESYYTPPAHAIREIQIIRGASSLQYGTQFGGLINFKLNELPKDKKWGIKSSQNIGSFGLFDTYNQVSINYKKWSVNTYHNYKRGNGYRANSNYKLHNFFGNIAYRPTDKITLSGEFTYFNYLAKQAGGLTDQQFEATPRLSTRDRNWFAVDWKLYNFKYQHELSSKSRLSLNIFMLNASRKSLGFRGNPINLNENPILALDEQDSQGNYLNPRDLILGTFSNYGAEFRWINEFKIGQYNSSVLLLGAKWYDANNTSIQGPGSTNIDADFSLQTNAFPDYAAQSNFRFPNQNLAFFGENIFYVGKKWSLTPGFRYEYINTGAEGVYNQLVFDNAGNPIANNQFEEEQFLPRHFALMGIGVEFKPTQAMQVFANLSQNYRSVTFSDIRVVSPSFIVDPDISDEKGLTFDVGIRGRKNKLLSYNISTFGVLYQDRIGIIFDDRANRVRKNIGDAFITGLEVFADIDLMEIANIKNDNINCTFFINTALTHSEYLRSESQNVVGKQVEFVPQANIKTGFSFGYKNLNASFQYAYLSKQFTDAQNSPIAQAGDLRSGIIGEVPAYMVADLTVSYSYKYFRFNTGINNLFNENYFTRRATGYPGPGIIPSEGRGLFLGVELLLGE